MTGFLSQDPAPRDIPGKSGLADTTRQAVFGGPTVGPLRAIGRAPKPDGLPPPRREAGPTFGRNRVQVPGCRATVRMRQATRFRAAANQARSSLHQGHANTGPCTTRQNQAAGAIAPAVCPAKGTRKPGGPRCCIVVGSCLAFIPPGPQRCPGSHASKPSLSWRSCLSPCGHSPRRIRIRPHMKRQPPTKCASRPHPRNTHATVHRAIARSS